MNHVAQQYLTQLLTPMLAKNENTARIIALSSAAHSMVKTKQFAAVLDKGLRTGQGPAAEDYDAWTNYAISKVSNVLFAREAQRKLGKQGVCAVSAHPGLILESDLWRSSGGVLTAFIKAASSSPFLNPRFYMNEAKSLSQGAATTLRCVSMTDDEIQGGHYYANCQSGTDAGLLVNAGKVRQYEDYDKESFEARLWKYTETLIKKKGFALAL